MIAVLLAAALAAEPPAPPSAPQTPQPPAGADLARAQEAYDRAMQLYAQTCNDRAYAAYDDLCDQLRIRVHDYRVELDKAERAAETAPAKAATPKR
jgi:hypothetical protein